MRSKTTAGMVLLIVVAIAAPAMATPAPQGRLDLRFGSRGVARAHSSSLDVARDSIRMSDGSIVEVGETVGIGARKQYQAPPTDLVLTRFTKAGVLDKTFGRGGIVIFDHAYNDAHPVLAHGPRNSIIVAAQADHAVMLLRFARNGALDRTFGSNGAIIFRMDDYYAAVSYYDMHIRVAVAGDGAIIVTRQFFNGWAVEIRRFNSDGTVETAFGVGGRVVVPVAPFDSRHQGASADVFDLGGIAVTDDGSIVVAGSGQPWNGPSTGIVFRVTPQGVRDPTFGVEGTVLLREEVGYDLLAYGVSLRKNGSALIGFGDTVGFAVVSLTANGSRDVSFGRNGVARLAMKSHHMGQEFANYHGIGGAMTVARDGSIYLAGTNRDWAATVTRVTAKGIFDRHFGRAGIANAPFAQAAGLIADGRGVYLAGSGFTGFNQTSSSDLMIARFI